MEMDDLAIIVLGIACLCWGAWGIYWAHRDGLIHSEVGVQDRDVEHGSYWAELVFRYAIVGCGIVALYVGAVRLL